MREYGVGLVSALGRCRGPRNCSSHRPPVILRGCVVSDSIYEVSISERTIVQEYWRLSICMRRFDPGAT
jgi:hypothetical protein